jgi:hypothetical protein
MRAHGIGAEQRLEFGVEHRHDFKRSALAQRRMIVADDEVHVAVRRQ